MAFLEVLTGDNSGELLEIKRDQVLLGRHPQCQVVLDNQAVSRYHAQILQSHGSYFLEDLRSRNGTHLNGEPIEGRTELHENDQLRICGAEFAFYLKKPNTIAAKAIRPTDPSAPARLTPRPPGTKVGAPVPEDLPDVREGEDKFSLEKLQENPEEESSSIRSTLGVGSSSQLRLSVKPEAKLRAVLEISKVIGQAIALDDVLEKVIDGLFRIYPQADEGFTILRHPVDPSRLVVRTVRARKPQENNTPRPSMTVIQQAVADRKAILSADASGDERFSSSQSMSDLQIRSLMCVPLITKEQEVLGALQIITRDLSQEFSEEDLDVLVSVASMVVMALESAMLHEERDRQRDLQKDLAFATQVQLGFLPTQRPKIEGYEFADFYEAAQNVGGDYFDYVKLPDNRLAFALGDVAGKGVSAALLMARLYSAARFHFLTAPTIGQAMTGLNAEISASGLGHRFITCVMGMLDLNTHQLTLANAGHMPPVISNTKGELRTFQRKDSGLPLGVLKDQEFTDVTIPFEPGDILLLFTDGISEATNPSRKLYGCERVNTFVREHLGQTAEEVVRGILGEVETFCEGEGQRDDMCLLSLRRLPLK